MKKLSCMLFLTLFVTCFNIVFSQTTNPQTQLPNVFPVNPKAFEFMKYTEIPVGKYTGVPIISIPIYNINTSGLNIPIGLSYHSNGFRVSEESGWTGLGWTLNAGGSVVQVVNELDDFGFYRNRDNESQSFINAIYGSNHNFYDNFGSVAGYYRDDEYVGVVEPFYLSSNAPCNPISACPWSSPNNTAIIYGTKDKNPDIFKFNMLGYSGEFVLDWKNENFKCISDKNIKIESSYSPNYSMSDIHPYEFTIITPDGNRFIFNVKEESSVSFVSYLGSTPNSRLEHLIGSKSSRVYQLTSILTNGGDVVNFNYIMTPNPLENFPAISLSKTFYSNTHGQPEVYFQNHATSITVNYSQQSFSYLSSIDFPKGKLIFNSSNDRIDFIGTHKLNSVVLKDKNNSTVKSFNFTYDYFVGHTSGSNVDNYLSLGSTYQTGKVASELTHRLKLESVRESGKPAYLFEYDSEPLPKKTSLAVDFWGRYNGKFSNVSFMPNIARLGIVNSPLTLVGIENNNNSVLAYSKAAVLKKITYPTGGTSIFDYELNSFTNVIIPDDDHSVTTNVFLNDRNNVNDSNAQIFSADEPSILYAGELNINTDGNIYTNTLSAYIRLTILKKTPENINLTSSSETFLPFYNSIPLSQAQNYINDVISDSRILELELINGIPETFKLLQNYSHPIDPDKIYIIQAYLDNSFGPQTSSSDHANASVYLSFIKNTTHDISYGGGLRIKDIKTKDQFSPPLIKSYSYSGGKLMSPLLYLTNSTTYYYDFSYPAPQVIFVTKMNSSSFYTISTNASGKYIGYDKVTEANSIINSSGNVIDGSNGSIEDVYTNSPDKFSFYTPFSNVNIDPIHINSNTILDPFFKLYVLAPLRKANIQNGLSKSNKVYDKEQNIIAETKNEWGYFEPINNQIYGRVMSNQYLQVNDYNNQFGQYHEYRNYLIGFYPIYATKTKLISSTKTQFFDGLLSNNVITKRLNFYDNYHQLNKTTQVNSKNDTINTYYQYPYNFIEYVSMTQDNVITPVIEKRVELNSTPISFLKNTYEAISGSFPRVFKKKITLTAKEDISNLEEEISYDLYRSAGNEDQYKLLQYHDRSGIYTTILWGYEGQYPVAKIDGSIYNQVSPLIDQSVLDNPIDDVQLKDALNILRVSLPDAQVTTYTYDPLIGVTSITDPRGYTIYYEYDEFNRLKQVKDAEGNIVSKNEYNYKN